VTLLLTAASADGTTVTAVSLDRFETPVDLVEMSAARDWRARGDGTIVASLATSPGSTRLAVWEPATATARWLTPDDGSLPQSAVWSPDGTFVYYAVAPHTCSGPCFSMWEIRADGTGRRQIYGPAERFGQPLFVTPDGRGLVWSRGQAGGSTDVLDIASGGNRAFPGGGGATQRAGWRTQRPRALVLTGTCCAGIPRGELSLWDDVDVGVTTLVGPRAADELGVSTAVWDPDGKRIAVTAVHPGTGGSFMSSIVILDGRQRTPLSGTDDLIVFDWVREGLIALRVRPEAGASEVVLVSPDSGKTTVVHTLGIAALVQVLAERR
jgi:dipeptidyl aminopeptidase/acylaminoacyl peptidase